VETYLKATERYLPHCHHADTGERALLQSQPDDLPKFALSLCDGELDMSGLGKSMSQ